MKNQLFEENLIIQTKITSPPVKNVVHRERLYAKLDEGRKRKLSIISAPAGYGKTTLVASWLLHRGIEYRWITLDRFDSSVRQFVNYLYAAMHSTSHNIGDDENSVVTGVLNRMASIHGEIVLVLDDYHLADTAEIRDFVSLLLEYLPPNFHLILITRVDPTLKTSRLRGQGEIIEIHEMDLQFTFEETKEFLSHNATLSLELPVIRYLAESTEGWIAGLQILVTSLKETCHTELSLNELKKDNRYLLDYLVEEVMSCIDSDVKDFLLKVSILERLHPGLCDAVTQRNDSQQLLEYLEHHNLFLTPLDTTHTWYRLHNLFADLLFTRCVQTYSDQLETLYTTASTWLEDHGYFVDAIECMFKANRIERGAQLIDKWAIELLMRGNLKSIAQWTRQLPPSIYKKYSITMFFHAWIEINEGRSDSQIEQLLDETEKRFPSSPFSILRSYIAMLKGHSREALQLAERAKNTLFQPYSFVDGIVNFSTALAKITNNEIKEALHLLSLTFEKSIGQGNTLIGVMSLDYQARILVHKGSLREAELLYKRAAHLATDPIGNYRWLAGGSLIGLGEIARLRGDLESATDYFQEGLSVSNGWVDFQNINAHIGLAQIHMSCNEVDEAFQEITYAEQLAMKLGVTLFDDRLVEYYKKLLLLRFGFFDEVKSLAFSDKGVDSLNSEISYLELYTNFSEILLCARISLVQEEYEEVLTLAHSIDDIASELGWPMQSFEAKLILILSYFKMGEDSRVKELLYQTIEFAELHTIIQPFVDEGKQMEQILQEALKEGRNTTFIRSLLSHFPHSSSPMELSGRELEVLTLFSLGLTNKEVAQRLCISERTIKWHSSNIYSKLNVKNRTQAVAVARTLKILP